MNRRNLLTFISSTVLIASLGTIAASCFADQSITSKTPQIKNESNVEIEYRIDGGKTDDACGFVGIGNGKIGSKKTTSDLKYKNADEVNFLCISFSEADKHLTESTTMVKIPVKNTCTVIIGTDKKPSLSKECEQQK